MIGTYARTALARLVGGSGASRRAAGPPICSAGRLLHTRTQQKQANEVSTTCPNPIPNARTYLRGSRGGRGGSAGRFSTADGSTAGAEGGENSGAWNEGGLWKGEGRPSEEATDFAEGGGATATRRPIVTHTEADYRHTQTLAGVPCAATARMRCRGVGSAPGVAAAAARVTGAAAAAGVAWALRVVGASTLGGGATSR